MTLSSRKTRNTSLMRILFEMSKGTCSKYTIQTRAGTLGDFNLILHLYKLLVLLKERMSASFHSVKQNSRTRFQNRLSWTVSSIERHHQSDYFGPSKSRICKPQMLSLQMERQWLIRFTICLSILSQRQQKRYKTLSLRYQYRLMDRDQSVRSSVLLVLLYTSSMISTKLYHV